MDSSFASETSVWQDSLTGLVTVPGWVSGLPGGRLPAAGSLIALELAGLGSVTQTFGAEASTALLREVVDRARKALPAEAALLRGAGNLLVVWLPGFTGVVAQAFGSHLRQAVCAKPVALPGGESLQPKLLIATLSANGQDVAQEAVRALERELVALPEFSAPPTGVTRAVSARAELEHRLEAMRLFGRDHMIEQVLARLNLPALAPQTVLLAGAPQTGKERILTGLLNLLGGQHLPLAEVECRPSDQGVPFTTLCAILYRFLAASPPDLLRQRLGMVLQTNPWLGGIFPMLQGEEIAPAPPEDRQLLRHTLETVLLTLARVIPHIAIVHNLHLADPDSLATLVAFQGMNGHGLRLIASADLEDDDVPAVLHRLTRQNAAVQKLLPFTPEQVVDYLREVAPEVAQPAIAARLHQLTGGMLLALEATLLAWVDGGQLALANNAWTFYPERVDTQAQLGLDVRDRQRLAKAALAGPTTVSFLAALWQVSEEEARATIRHGRALGFLAAEEAAHADAVAFADPEHVSALARTLTSAQRLAAHAEIATLLESTHAGDINRHSPALAYHFTSAGQTERAQAYARLTQAMLPTLLPMLVSPDAVPIGGLDGWDVPPSIAIEHADINKLIDAALALRLAGVQFRLYPPNSEIVRMAVQDAVQTLERLFTTRPSFIITYDGHTIAFDGQIFQRRDLKVAIKDFMEWMTDGNLRAIGITRGIRDNELSRFLHTLVTYAPAESETPLLSKVAALNLMNIRILTRSFQPDLPQTSVPGPGAPLVASPGAGPDEHESWPPERMPAVVSTGGDLPPQDPLGPGGIPMLTNPAALPPECWAQLPAMMDHATPHTRRTMLTNLGRWVADEAQRPSARLPESVDTLLIARLRDEQDPAALHETVAVVELRLDMLMRQGNWEAMIALLDPIQERVACEETPELRRICTTVLKRVGEGTALRGLIDQSIQQTGELDRARRLVIMLGEFALRPLINALKNASAMQERIRVMQLLREFGDIQQPLLLQELREPNAWYVYRNLLSVLAEVGTDEALGAISDKIRFPDARVRVEAVAAATRIAKENAVPYLAQGLEDEDADVRTRAASLVGLCPQPRILEAILRLLHPRLGKEEPESVQLTATLALGQFTDAEAREVLLAILFPKLFSPFRKKSETIRSAAVTALANHLEDPHVIAAIQQALHDRSALVRQAAQRAWQQHLQRQNAPPTA